jgi:4'-phosphopantetheinyl transferase
MKGRELNRPWLLPSPGESYDLATGEIHVWKAVLSPGMRMKAQKVLSSVENARAGRLRKEEDRIHFEVAHGALRHILGSYLRMAPGSVSFRAQEQGKPELHPSINPQGITFNLSHSGDVALVAVALRTSVGIDVESVDDDIEDLDIAERFFSRNEAAALRALPPDQRKSVFFNCWTRKEAFIKARGEGLSIPLDSFEVELLPGKLPALLGIDNDPAEAKRWSIYDLDVGMPYKAALAAEGCQHEIRCWVWS